MDKTLFATVFGTVLLAELGDKTQLATLLYAASASHAKTVVFIAAALALVVAAGLGVIAGGLLARWLEPALLNRLSGIAFIAVGAWLLWRT